MTLVPLMCGPRRKKFSLKRVGLITRRDLRYIAKCIETKTLKQVIRFYYSTWKLRLGYRAWINVWKSRRRRGICVLIIWCDLWKLKRYPLQEKVADQQYFRTKTASIAIREAICCCVIHALVCFIWNVQM